MTTEYFDFDYDQNPCNTAIVNIQNGTAYANSRDIAHHMKANHDDLVIEIYDLIEKYPEMRQYFRETSCISTFEHGSFRDIYYDMTMTGFMLISDLFPKKTRVAYRHIFLHVMTRHKGEIEYTGTLRSEFTAALREPVVMEPSVEETGSSSLQPNKQATGMMTYADAIRRLADELEATAAIAAL